jgi:hypothetical protein
LGQENIGSSADARAQGLRDQADAFRRLAASEPLPEKRKLLVRAAARCDELAAQQQRIAEWSREEFHRHAERTAKSPSPK